MHGISCFQLRANEIVSRSVSVSRFRRWLISFLICTYFALLCERLTICIFMNGLLQKENNNNIEMNFQQSVQHSVRSDPRCNLFHNSSLLFTSSPFTSPHIKTQDTILHGHNQNTASLTIVSLHPCPVKQ